MPQSPPGAPQRLGDYEVLQWIATGGMAEVYIARRQGARGFTKLVALKRMLPKFATDPEFVAMFTDEAQVCSGLSHPNLVEVFDFGEEKGELFMAMELVDGTTCARLVRAAAARGEGVPLEDVLFITLNVLRGLEYAHDAEDDHGNPLNLVHRDVSPGNVLISRTGAVKLADFGIARAAHPERRPEGTQLKGKLGYMSPEQVAGKEIDRRCDLFTLGIVLAELLTCRPLFSHGTELDILYRIRDVDLSTFLDYSASLPTPLQKIVLKALARDPAERYQNASVFAEAIEAFVRDERLALGPLRLHAYTEALGLVKPTSRSGEFRFRGLLDSTPRAKPMRLPRPVIGDVTPATYRIRAPSGAQQGPLPLSRVLELFVTGRIPFDSVISRNNGPFQPPTEHPELRRIAAISRQRWDTSAAPGEVSQRPFDGTTLPALLYRAAQARETATVLIAQGSRRKKLHLTEGLVTQVSSTETSELLGERLLRAGRILPVELDMALALSPRHGGHVGDALVGLGILRPLDLYQALYEQTAEHAAELLSWRSGELSLLPREPGNDGLPRGISLLEIVTDGILRSYDEATLEALLLPFEHAALQPGERGAPCPHALRLAQAPAAALLLVDGQRTLGELLERLTSDRMATRHEVLAGVFIGLSCGAIEAAGWGQRLKA